MNIQRTHKVNWLDVFWTGMIWFMAGLCLFLPFMLVVDILYRGLPSLTLNFLWDDPMSAGREGGIYSIIISTFWVLLVCFLVVIPIGLGSALYLSECVKLNSKRGQIIRLSLRILSSVPSIVFGLFGYAMFAIYLKMGFSILSGGLSLACMVLPLFILISEQAFQAVPIAYKQSSLALNISQGAYMVKILLPMSSSGVVSALIISIGRALAETAVLIYTAGYVTRMPGTLYDSGRVLSVHIYDLSMNVIGGQQNAATTAAFLLILLILLNVLARRVSHRLTRYAR
ncbi:phosphate ABC transporter permease PstA [Shewanella surugensis]|uniref:Phosphate transport system permease protein PstA n=1 Tax=Shewanella surugensis TaxID=212020 RepID=A0ABT0L8C7_9GAMM|nr:phosphate ABC transporter permease PstA [Shewanella surugensis]MCL1123953.1 phosphate ABC transporter permease PstA [Shewanella surugensis]